MRKNIFAIGLATLLLALSLGSGAKAGDWDKKTVVTFNQDVEIPGWVLPAGTYVFKLFDSSSNRYIVQVWDQDEMHVIATLMTVGDSYPNETGNSYFVLDTSQTDEGYPPAVVSWFFAGSNEGRDFIYSAYSTTQMTGVQENNSQDNQDDQGVPDDSQAQPAPTDNSQPQPDEYQPEPQQ